MKSLKLVKYPADILKQKAKKIEKVDESIKELVEAMFVTMFENEGVGLAAPQIGQSIQLFVAAPEGKKGPRFVYINPEILSGDGKDCGPEGCLSFPGVYGTVERFKEIQARFLDLGGNQKEEKIEGFLARIYQHEKDHLDGVVFVEHLGFNERKSVLDEYKKLQQIAL